MKIRGVRLPPAGLYSPLRDTILGTRFLLKQQILVHEAGITKGVI